jgi:hypothetical protein
MATVVEAVPTWTYCEAAKILGYSRQTVSELARREKLVRRKGRPLDERGLRRLAELLNVRIEFARSA